MKRPLLFLLAVIAVVATGCATNPESLTPELQFTQPASGCSDLFVYRSNAAGTEYVLVEANRQTLGLTTQPKTFDLATTTTGLRVAIDIYTRKPMSPRYCNDALIADDPSPAVWQAYSGRVTISISSENPVSNQTYTATVRVEDATFRAKDGETVFLKDVVFENVMVGWLPG